MIFISATRKNEKDFWSTSPLGISLLRLAKFNNIKSAIFYENSVSLTKIYNASIKKFINDDNIILIHDDVWIDDFYVLEHLKSAFEKYQIVGLAGKKTATYLTTSWAFDENSKWDERENLSGAVSHGKKPFGEVSYYGSTPAKCDLIDGLFMAIKKKSLNPSHQYFDERFDFHFYDLDFCLTARLENLTIGTWPIAVTHQSGGSFKSEGWQKNWIKFKSKWELSFTNHL